METVAPQAASTGENAEEATARNATRADRPMMIYVVADDATDKLSAKLESVVFPNEQLGVGAKFFDTIRMTASNAAQDRLLKDAGKSAPRIVFVTRDYKVAAVFDKKGQLSAGKLVKAMKRVVKAEYVNSFDKMVKSYIKLLNELDRLEGRKAQVADLRARLQAKPSASKEKKLKKAEAELAADLKTWGEREKEALALKVKGTKVDPKA
ncbi:MAG: hypothetical protein ACYTGN_09685 [Planctomycetota bacterium]|jgi:hypothetical protein